MPVSETSKAMTEPAPERMGWSGLQPLADGSDAQLDAALFSELEGVGEQVFEDLLETLGVSDEAAANARDPQ